MDKTDRLLSALDNTESYSDSQLETLLSDPEMRELYADIRLIKGSISSPEPAAPDVDAEWQRFSRRAGLHRRLSLRKVAAIIAGGVVAAGAVAATFGIAVSRNETTYSEASEPVAVAAAAPQRDSQATDPAALPDVAQKEEAGEEAAKLRRFSDASLESILAEIGSRHGVSVVFINPEKRSLRLFFTWDTAMPLQEVVDALGNFEQMEVVLADSVITVK